MRALEHTTQAKVLIFASPRYWPDNDELAVIYGHVQKVLEEALAGLDVTTTLIYSADDLRDLGGGAALLVPLSGGVQAWMIEAASGFEAVALLPAYMPGPLSLSASQLALARNAAPAAVEVWSLFKRGKKLAIWAEQANDFVQLALAVQAVARLRRLRLLLLGGPENWVQSSERDLERLSERVGVSVTTVPLRVLEDYATRVEAQKALLRAQAWIERAERVVEPDEKDVVQACCIELALEQMLDFYDADGAAVACFSLIGDISSTACLALASLNASTHRMGACEGDVDAAVTLALAKALTGQSAWMANPVIGRDDTILFAHCTAPVAPADGGGCLCLRSHHESGLGVSPQVGLWMGQQVTVVRFGRDSSALSVFPGRALDGASEPTCRTQLRVRLASRRDFVEHLLGNHQVIVPGDWARAFGYCAALLGLDCYTGAETV